MTAEGTGARCWEAPTAVSPAKPAGADAIAAARPTAIAEIRTEVRQVRRTVPVAVVLMVRWTFMTCLLSAWGSHGGRVVTARYGSEEMMFWLSLESDAPMSIDCNRLDSICRGG